MSLHYLVKCQNKTTSVTTHFKKLTTGNKLTTCLLSQLLSKVTVASCSLTSNVQCVHVAAGRHTLKMHCYRSRLLFNRCFKTLGSLVIVLLQMFSRFWKWNKFENRSTFDEVKAYKIKCASFLEAPYMWMSIIVLTTAKWDAKIGMFWDDVKPVTMGKIGAGYYGSVTVSIVRQLPAPTSIT